MRLRKKVAIITGAGSGIGRATAVLFSQEGAEVVVVDINREGGAEHAGHDQGKRTWWRISIASPYIAAHAATLMPKNV